MSKYRIVQVSNRSFYVEGRLTFFLWIRFWVRYERCYSSLNEAERIVEILLKKKSFKSKIIKYYP